MARKNFSHVNVAVVGLGFMGVTHLRAYQQTKPARIVAVCGQSRLPENGVLKGVAGNIKKSDDIHLGNRVKVYRDYAELLCDPEVELVDLCTPTALHPAQVTAALKAGKHVVCEKPLAQTAAEAAKILRVAVRSRGFLMPAMCMRFWPGWNELKQVVQRHTYGKVLSANFRRLSPMPGWGSSRTYGGAEAGGALFDLHIHDVDFVHFVFGRPHQVASTGVVGRGQSVNHVITQYYYSDGPAVVAEGSWLHHGGFNMAFTLHCERATIEYDFSRGPHWQLSEMGKGSRTVRFAKTDGYRAEIDYFVGCVARGVRPQLSAGTDAVTALQICEAEYESVLKEVPVKL